MDIIRRQWKLVPVWIRKPLTFIIGWIFIIAAALTGWLPGPGGIPLFLIGIAILATEYAWAKRLQKVVLNIVYACGRWYRRHHRIGTLLLIAITILGAICLYIGIARLVKTH